MKVFKKIVSILIAVTVCLAVLPSTIGIKSSAAKYAYTGNLDTSVIGTHHWPGNCLGGTSIKVLGANEVSTDQYVYNTDREGTADQVDIREMSDSDAPVATFYVDANDTDYTVTLLCQMTADTYANIINCQFDAPEATKNNCSISDVGWTTQWYFKHTGVSDTFTDKTIEFTGKTPSAPGQTTEYTLLFMTDIANTQTGYIHAVYKLKIRFVAFGNTVSGKTTVTNHILRNWTDLYCYDAVMSAYNVDGGTNGEYINNADGGYTASDSDFDLKSTATAFAYIDRTQYSRMEDTPILFSHHVTSLCANGTGGWSWAGIRVNSSNGSFTSSVGSVDYTIDNTKGVSFLNNVYNLPFKICGDLPAAGEPLTITVSGYYNANATKTGYNYNAYTDLVLTLYLYDKTELNSAINDAETYLDSESKYSQQSVAGLKKAYNEALAISNSQTAKQSEIDGAKTDLINAVNNLERVQTVTLDGQSATTAGTTSVVATIGKAMPSITRPTREHYSFMGYFTQPDGKGVQYYNADGSSARDFDLESDVTLYASWSIDKFNVKFVNYDGTLLESGDFDYGTKPTYDGDDPVRSADDDTEYTFSGWSPEITEVTADVTYTAQFTANEHNYSCVKIDENSHQYVCTDCGYKKAAEAHFFSYSANDKKTHTQVCVDCGYETEKEAHHFETVENNDEYSDEYSGVFVSTCTDCGMVIKAKKYKVELSNGCTVKYSIKPEVTAEYAVATIVAPMQEGDTYFVYWTDGEGNIVGTYRTYSFFVTDVCKFAPKHVPLEQYESARKDATSVSRVTGGRYDVEYRTYTIYTEHSVSTTVGSITGHGVIYTTNSAYANSLTTDNDNVTKKAALSSATTLTGLLAVSDKEISLGDTVWARSYIIDETGKNIIYGKVKVLTVTADDGTSEIGTLGCESFDLTAVNAEGDTPTDPTDDTPTEQSPIEKLMSILSKLVDFIKKILEFFKISEVIK